MAMTEEEISDVMHDNWLKSNELQRIDALMTRHGMLADKHGNTYPRVFLLVETQAHEIKVLNELVQAYKRRLGEL